MVDNILLILFYLHDIFAKENTWNIYFCESFLVVIVMVKSFWLL